MYICIPTSTTCVDACVDICTRVRKTAGILHTPEYISSLYLDMYMLKCIYDMLMYAHIYLYMYIHIYIYAHPPTTRKNPHFAHLPITVIGKRMRKSKNKSKTFYNGILHFFFWIFGFLDFWIFRFLDFWGFGIWEFETFDMCSGFLLFCVLFVCCAWLLVYICSFERFLEGSED